MTGVCGQRARVLAVLAIALGCGPAQAHLEATGLGPVYDGMLHFLTSPEDLVPALALALLAGLRGAAHSRRTMFTLPASWLLGGLAGLSAASVSAGPLAAAFWFVLLGGLVVADAKLSLRSMTLLAALIGLVHGYLNGTGMGLSTAAVVALFGLAGTVFVAIVLVAALCVALRSPWARVAMRVGGSWIAASGLLLLGWSLRGV
ncbi:MAG TPA: HupE/UreJ family protein [Rubrivivax sp.]|jgi:hydrogenase/urease accessory protein HupE|nr:HupE/UreJ family protein [Rubrivivax sp.]